MEFLKYEFNFLCLKKSSSSKTDIFWSDEYWEAACYWLRAFYCWIIRYVITYLTRFWKVLLMKLRSTGGWLQSVEFPPCFMCTRHTIALGLSAASYFRQVLLNRCIQTDKWSWKANMWVENGFRNVLPQILVMRKGFQPKGKVLSSAIYVRGIWVLKR